jgi:TorA maturation chaperone TorD
MKQDSDSAYLDAVARGNMYRFLAALYLQAPTLELVRNTMDVEFLEELALLFGESPVVELINYASSVDLENDVALIKQDYMDLFAVPAGRYVTPFEDVYRGTRVDGGQERGPLLGVRAIAVKIMYRMAGVEMESTCKELPTHIGVELAFMNYLCDSEAATMRDNQGTARPDPEKIGSPGPGIYRRLQGQFLKEHLNDWFPQLSQAIQAKAATRFYRGLAQLTEAFIACDAASLSAEISVEKCAQAIQAVPQPG